MFHPGIVSTLFPHLPHRRSAPFRLALLAGAALLLVFGLTGVTAAGIAAACLIMPALYLIYLYEAEVYEDEPELVIGATLLTGIVLGLIWTNLTSSYITTTVVLNSFSAAPAGREIVAGVLIPLGAATLMLVGPAILYFRHYDEAMDGFAFGAASGLGFTLATNLVDLWPQLSQGLTNSHATFDGALTILARGILLPFIAASATGVVAAAFWVRKGRRRSTATHRWTASPLIVVVVMAGMWIGLGLINISISSITTVVAIYTVVAVILLLAVRVSLHHMLLAEAVEVPIGPPNICFHCHYEVPRMAFCPHCGIATRSTPKHGHGRLARAFR
ncbi:MAG: PrsW family glutamic-type intramembrane protease [Opitutales bacterium]